jgi:FkbM family methyltransferase
LGFEPTPGTNAILRRTIRLNRVSDVVVARSEAVSDATGSASFFDTGDAGSNANSLVRGERSRRDLSVQTVTVDESARQAGDPKVVKIDVEGAELAVLRGAALTIERSRPVIWLALHPEAIARSGGSLQDVWEIAARLRMRVLFRQKPMTRDKFVNQRSLFDVALLPEEMAERRG